MYGCAQLCFGKIRKAFLLVLPIKIIPRAVLREREDKSQIEINIFKLNT